MSLSDKPLISIFTAVFNRASLLLDLYESIEAQSYRNVEWVIVDDGSSDGTADSIRQITESASFPVIARRQPHGGKHRAYNLALPLMRGEFIHIVDSDDLLLEHGLESAVDIWQRAIVSTPPEKLLGVYSVSVTEDGRPVGDTFTCCTEFNVRHLPALSYQENIKGDKSSLLYASNIRQFRFPEFSNEIFVPEGVIWNRMSTQLDVVASNQPVQIIRYQPDGISSMGLSYRMKSPKAMALYYAELLEHDVPLKHRAKALIAWGAYFWEAKGNGATKIPCPNGVVCGLLGRIGGRIAFFWLKGRAM